jgi:Transposase DDE domain group 1
MERSFDHKIIEFIEEKHAFYVIVARLSRPLKNRLPGLRYRRVWPGVWTSEFWYCPQGWPGPRRFVVIRRSVPEEPSAQLHLFQMGGYSYQLLVTNLKLTPLHLWRFYNQRARAELIIRELKDAYALGKIVLLAYNLLNWFKRLCVPVHLQRATLPRLRQRLLFVPAQFVRPGGVPTLRLAPSYAFTADFLATLRRIRRIQPLFRVTPPRARKTTA